MPTTATKERRSDDQHAAAERIYYEWDRALAKLEELPPERLEEGVEALLALYAKDAIIESPLIPHLMGVERGICAGHEEMRPFFREVGRRTPNLPPSRNAAHRLWR